MTITLSWWIMPVLTTILFFAIAWAKCQPEQSGGYFPDIFTGFFNLFLFAIALIGSLLSWLVFFIIF